MFFNPDKINQKHSMMEIIPSGEDVEGDVVRPGQFLANTFTTLEEALFLRSGSLGSASIRRSGLGAFR